MTYWGAPAPGGSKFYLGSSGDTAWNHDILWKARVEKEVAELDPDSLEGGPEGHDDSSYVTGVNDRTWAPSEIEMLRDAVRVHGAGNFGTILSNPQFIALRSHSEQACKEQWRLLEYRRSKSLGATRADWRKTTSSTKRAIQSRQREQKLRQQAKSFGRSPSSPNELRASWRGSGQLPLQASGERKSFSLQQTNGRGRGAFGVKGSPLARSGSRSMKKFNTMKTRANTNAHPELPSMGTIHNLEKSLQKEIMKRDQMARTLREGQNQRTSIHLDLLQERKQRRKAEAALQKYQRVLETLANQTGLTQGAQSADSASPLLRKSQSSGTIGSGSRGGLSGRSLQTKKAERRQMLKQMLMQAEQGKTTSMAGSHGLLDTKAAGFF